MPPRKKKTTKKTLLKKVHIEEDLNLKRKKVQETVQYIEEYEEEEK
jgi:hypothetical protein